MKQILFQNQIPKIIILAFVAISCSVLVPLPPTITANATDGNLDKIPAPETSLENPDDDPDEEAPEPYDFPYPIIIKAIHPGYKIDGVSDVGELIELQNLSDAPLSLAGFSLRYTNSSGKEITIFEFAEGSLMTGETLLFRYAKSPEHEQADLNYATSLAMSAGPLKLVAEDTVIDEACWTGKSGCAKAFKSASPTALVRDLITGDFVHQESYAPSFDPDNPSYVAPPEPETPGDDSEESDSGGTPQCFALEFSEIYSYYAADQSEQFIELYNPSTIMVSLDGCQFRYKKKLYELSGTIAPDDYFVFYPGEQFSLTKNPSSTVSIELIDADGSVVEELSYPKGQKKSTSYARIFDSDGTESWLQTYAITPGAENIYQEYRTCESGKAINPLTGNCVKISSLSTTPKVCEEGKYLNPLTGRCKSISSTESTLTPCAEGYERNPETNRCRKITSTNDGAEYALVPNTRSDGKTFIAFGAVALLVLAGVVYIALQFRREIARMVRKIRQRLNHIFQDLLAGKIGLHRDKKP